MHELARALKEGEVPETGTLFPCPCGATYTGKRDSILRLVEPQTIGGKDHPAQGYVITQGYVYCQNCGTQAARADTKEQAITNWNLLVV
jgi:hypothetical protein